MKLWLDHALHVLCVLWIGSLVTIGGIVAPTLFATLPDRILAGTLAGRFFYIESCLSLGLGLFFAVYWSRWGRPHATPTIKPRYLAYLCAAIAALAAVQLWGLQPAIVALREQAAALGGSVAQAPAALRQQFGLLHGLSTLAYAIQIGLGMGLVAGLVALKRR